MVKPILALNQLGTESAFEVLARANMLMKQGQEIINLGIGQPDFRTPHHIVEAAIKALRDGHHGYTAANGLQELREAVSEDIKTYRGVTIDPDLVMIVPGGKVTMYFAIMMFGEKGSEILYPNPGFPIYESLIRFFGATPIPMPLYENTGYAFDADEVLSLITKKSRLLILNSPSNPTGGIVPKKQIDKLINGLSSFPNLCILSDEIYSRMLYDGKKHISLLQYEHLHDRLIILDGWSKTFSMTGWRLGYGIWPKNLIDHANRLAINCHSCVNTASQFAGIAALKGSQIPVSKMMGEFEKRRKLIVRELNQIPGLKCPNPGGAFYVFPNIKDTGFTSAEFQDMCLTQAGVATIAGTSFGHLGEGYMRFSYANSTQNIVKAIEKIKNLLKSL